jgi:hypothetical protein
MLQIHHFESVSEPVGRIAGRLGSIAVLYGHRGKGGNSIQNLISSPGNQGVGSSHEGQIVSDVSKELLQSN